MALGVFITATHVYSLVLFLTACIPLSAYWSADPRVHCVVSKTPYIIGSALFAATDAVVLLMPLPLIWRMRTSWTRRLQLTSIFFLGSWVVGVAIVKAVLVVRLSISSLRLN